MQAASFQSFYLGISKTNKMIPINQTVSVEWMLELGCKPQPFSKTEFRLTLRQNIEKFNADSVWLGQPRKNFFQKSLILEMDGHESRAGWSDRPFSPTLIIKLLLNKIRNHYLNV